MNHRQDFFAILEGRAPERAAFFPDISDWYGARRTPRGQAQWCCSGRFAADDDPRHRVNVDMPPEFADFTYLDFYREFDWGFPWHSYEGDWYEIQYDGVDVAVTVEGDTQTTTLSCPRGKLTQVKRLAADGSWAPTRHFAQTLDDLDILKDVVERTQYVPTYEILAQHGEATAGWGVCDAVTGRGPFGRLVQDYLGFEKVIYALHDDPARVLDFLAFHERKDLELIELAARSPARIVIISDHADENLISPRYYRRYCIPFYRKAAEILHSAGKFVSTHLDGNFRGYFPCLAETGFDLLDGCTPAPMMNYEVEELAAALPDGMHCYCGVPSTLFTQRLDDEQILAFGRRILDAFAGRVILNVGDLLPANGDIHQVIRLGEMAKEYTVPK